MSLTSGPDVERHNPQGTCGHYCGSCGKRSEPVVLVWGGLALCGADYAAFAAEVVGATRAAAAKLAGMAPWVSPSAGSPLGPAPPG